MRTMQCNAKEASFYNMVKAVSHAKLSQIHVTCGFAKIAKWALGCSTPSGAVVYAGGKPRYVREDPSGAEAPSSKTLSYAAE